VGASSVKAKDDAEKQKLPQFRVFELNMEGSNSRDFAVHVDPRVRRGKGPTGAESGSNSSSFSSRRRAWVYSVDCFARCLAAFVMTFSWFSAITMPSARLKAL